MSGAARAPKPVAQESGGFFARVDQMRLYRVSLAILCVAAVGFFAAGVSIRPRIELAEGGRRSSAAELKLLDVLHRLRSAWDPRERERILSAAPEAAPRLSGPLRRVLRAWDHPLAAEAVDYAGAMGDVELRPEVAAQAARGPVDLRARAMRAAKRLEPWLAGELRAFLSSERPEIKIAALQIAATRVDAPWVEVFDLLASDESAVRDAALAAVPRDPPPEARRALLGMAQNGDPELAVVGLAAMSRAGLAADFEAEVAGLLATAVPGVRRAALELLGQKGAPLERAQAAVEEVIWDLSAEPEVRAMALLCLERTGSQDVEALSAQIYALEPRLQYFAARCLVAAGHRDGPKVLLDLAAADTRDVAVAARQLLAALTGLGPGASPEQFSERLGQLGVESLPVAAMPAPGISF